MKRLVAVCAAVLALGLAGCSKHALKPGEGNLDANGRVQLVTADQPWHFVSGEHKVRSGDRVRVLQGTARVTFTNNRTVELRRGSTLEVRRQPVLLGGDALVTTPDTPLTVGAAGTDVHVAGASKISRGLAVAASAYSGSLDIDSVGHRLHVPHLRTAAVTAPGFVPDRPSPMTYDASDSWDRRFLGDAIELGDELLTRSRGFTQNLTPDEGRTAGFYRQLIPALGGEPGFTQDLVDGRPSAGDVLVGSAIALQGRGGDFRSRWSEIFTFYDEGARWGLVALDQDIRDRPQLLSVVDVAIGRAPSLFTQPAVVQAAAPAPPAPAPGPAPAPAATAPPAGTPASSAPSSSSSSGSSRSSGTGAAAAGKNGTPPPATGSPLPGVTGGPPPDSGTPQGNGIVNGLGAAAGGLLNTVGGLLGNR